MSIAEVDKLIAAGDIGGLKAIIDNMVQETVPSITSKPVIAHIASSMGKIASDKALVLAEHAMEVLAPR